MMYIRQGHARPRLPESAGYDSTPPESFNTPKMLAMDYRSNTADFSPGSVFGTEALNLHKKYKYNILNMTYTQANPGSVGYNFVQALVADDPTRLIGQYTIASQQYDADFGAPYSDVYNALNAGDTNGRDYWARDAITGEKTKTDTVKNYPTYEVNLCPAFTLANSSGKKAPEIIADGLASLYYTNLYNAGARMFFCDNFWTNPGGFTSNGAQTIIYPTGTGIGTFKVADYNYDGANDTRDNTWAGRTSTLNQEWRKGLANYVARFEVNFPGIKSMGNTDGDFTADATWGNNCLMTTELTGKVDFAFLEAVLSNVGNDAASPGAYRGNFDNILNRVYSADDNARMGAVLSCYVMSTAAEMSGGGLGRTLQKGRMTIGVALLADCWASVSDRLTGSANMRPYWMDECEQPIGDPDEARPTIGSPSTGFDGMYKRNYTNGMVVVNPSSNKGRWMNNGYVQTLTRASNVVTFKLPTANCPAGLIAGVNIRIQDCNSTTFNGIWTVTGRTTSGSNQLITWSQTAANVAEFTPTTGYWGMQSTVDFNALGLTGLYKHFLGTQDSHTGYDGTAGVNSNNTPSQNDGSVVTTLKLWPNDAVILLKV